MIEILEFDDKKHACLLASIRQKTAIWSSYLHQVEVETTFLCTLFACMMEIAEWKLKFDLKKFRLKQIFKTEFSVWRSK
jgi:hypothetical protein